MLARKIVIESPFRASADYTEGQNVEFAKEVCRYAIRHGYAPFASHLFYTQLLDDTVPFERALGVQLGFVWGVQADEIWFCLRPGEERSEGMKEAYNIYSYSGFLMKNMKFTEKGEFISSETL